MPGLKTLSWKSSAMPLASTFRAAGPSMKIRVRLCDKGVTMHLPASCRARSSFSGPTSQNCRGAVRKITRPLLSTAVSARGGSGPATAAMAISVSASKPAAWVKVNPRASPSERAVLVTGLKLARAERRSSIEAFSLGIDKVRRDDTRARELILQREGADDLLADMLEPALIESKRDGLLQLCRPRHRGDIAAAMALDLIGGGKQDRATAEGLGRFQQFEANETPAIRRLQVLAHPELLADEILFLGRHLAKAKIIEAVAVVEFEAGDMALLDTQAGQSLEAVGLDAKRGTR